jgi:uracil-DNA glycosylase family 4
VGVVGSQGPRGELVATLRAYVEYQRELGVLGFPPTPAETTSAGSAASPRAAATAERTAAAAPSEVAGVAPGPDLFIAPLLQRATTLEALRAELGDCQRCKLAGGRTHIVFGVGNPRARLVFVGEGPGHDEDLKGEPFVGRAGQLLTEIITKGMRLRREDVYIANVVKCRPPGNRNPEPDEVAACEPFLLRQLELIRPEVIVALGKFAVQTLLRSKAPISQMRGRWYDYHGMRLMPTFHPAYLLRNPADKRLVWEDIQKVMHALGIGGAAT